MLEDEARTLAFLSLVVSIVSLILINRSFSASLNTAFRSPNPTLVWIALAVAAIMTLSFSLPALSALFRFAPLHWHNVILAAMTGLAVLILLELLKPLWRERLRS